MIYVVGFFTWFFSDNYSTLYNGVGCDLQSTTVLSSHFSLTLYTLRLTPKERTVSKKACKMVVSFLACWPVVIIILTKSLKEVIYNFEQATSIFCQNQ